MIALARYHTLGSLKMTNGPGHFRMILKYIKKFNLKLQATSDKRLKLQATSA